MRHASSTFGLSKHIRLRMKSKARRRFRHYLHYARQPCLDVMSIVLIWVALDGPPSAVLETSQCRGRVGKRSLLLVSLDYLASRFIQEEEHPELLQRRQETQLRVIPIIVRPCKWQSEPVLRDLQALPKEEAVIKFLKATGAGRLKQKLAMRSSGSG